MNSNLFRYFSLAIISLILFSWTSRFNAEEPRPEIPPPELAPRPINPGLPCEGIPSDAVELFDGSELTKWEKVEGGEAAWEVSDGAATVNGTGNIRTRESYGDCQFHLEFATPAMVKGEGQGRGNSGVYFLGRYEVQILDSYNNPTYFHGQAGSVYKQYAPLVNASRKPGDWQSYDIIFRGPRFEADGKLARPAYITALHNGVLIQDHVELKGATSHTGYPEYKAHPVKQPIMLQDHGNPVKFRNIWLREL